MSFFGACLGVGANHFLDFVPGLHVYYGVTVILNDEISEFKNADEDLICSLPLKTN